MLPTSNSTKANSATSDSYRSHLRNQLREWQRAFKSKHGRAPLQPDFEALRDDGSARGKLLHRSYVELNRATDNAFAKVVMIS